MAAIAKKSWSRTSKHPILNPNWRFWPTIEVVRLRLHIGHLVWSWFDIRNTSTSVKITFELDFYLKNKWSIVDLFNPNPSSFLIGHSKFNQRTGGTSRFCFDVICSTKSLDHVYVPLVLCAQGLCQLRQVSWYFINDQFQAVETRLFHLLHCCSTRYANCSTYDSFLRLFHLFDLWAKARSSTKSLFTASFLNL